MAALFSAGHPWGPLLVPFLVAAVGAGVVRLIGGPGRGAALAGLALPLGFLAAWLLMRGVPGWPPRSAAAQVPFVALIGLLVGAAVTAASAKRGVVLAVAAAFALLAVWSALGWPRGGGWQPLLKAALLAGIWLVALVRLEGRPAKEPVAAVMLAMLALGIGVVAATAGDALARPAFALAAATAGFLAWNWFGGAPFLGSALLGGGGAAMALAGAVALGGRASPLALAVLLLILFADGTASRLPSGSGLVRQAVQPLLLALLCLLPIGLAFGLAHVPALR